MSRGPDVDPEIVREVLGTPLLPESIVCELPADGIRAYASSAVASSMLTIAREDDVLFQGMELTQDRIDRLRREPHLREAAVLLQVANDALTNWHRPPAMPEGSDAPDTPRAIFQAHALGDLVAHAQRAPNTSQTKAGNPYRNGYLTVAPPGGGKTPLQALMFNYTGVGLPVNEAFPERRHGVGILTSRILMRQYLDPSGPFQRYLDVNGRKISVGAYYQAKHQGHDDFDIILTTPQSYPEAVRSGAINRTATVNNTLDEAHRSALAPGMQRHLGRFAGLYMYTATPAYDSRRDLRRRFPYSQFGTMRSFIEDGILNPAQLFTYRAEAEPGSEAKIAVDLAAEYVASGRKTLIVCQPGDDCLQAREIAAALNHHFAQGAIKPHPRFGFEEDTLACAIGQFRNSDTKADLHRLKHNKRLVATTVATGQEGLDMADLDALIIIGPRCVSWELQQWMGRVLRQSDRVSIISEILPNQLRAGRPLVSIFGELGVEPDGVIRPGYFIGPRGEGDFDRETSKSSARNSAGATAPTELFEVPPGLTDALVLNTSVREATVAPADLARQVPEDYKPLFDLVPEGVPIDWLYNRLDEQTDDPEIRYVGVIQANAEGGTEYVRYYSPKARAFFETNPVPALAAETELGIDGVATMFHVSPRYAAMIVDELGIEPTERLNRLNRRRGDKYDLESIIRIGERIGQTPLADETDIPVTDLCRVLGSNFVRTYTDNPDSDIKAAYKRRHPLFGAIGITRHITEHEATRIQDAFDKLAVVDKTKYIGFSEIAELAGLSLHAVLDKFAALDPENKPDVSSHRVTPKGRTRDYVDRRWGAAYANYVKPQKMQPWQLSTKMVAGYFGKKPPEIIALLKDKFPAPPKVQLVGDRNKVSIYPFAAILDLLDQGLLPAPDMPKIDEQQVALTQQDVINNPSRLAANHRIQRIFTSPTQLATAEEAVRYAPPVLPPKNIEATNAESATNGADPFAFIQPQEALDRLNCTESAFRILLVSSLAASEVERDDKNIVVGIQNGAVGRILRARFPAAREGWVSRTRLLVALAARTRGQSAPHLAQGGQELMRSPSTNILDVYYPPDIARRLLRAVS